MKRLNTKLILILLLVTLDSAATLSKSDIRCLQILSYTKRQTEALIIEHMSGHADYGIAHLEFLRSLDNPHRVIHCATSKKILREYNLLDSRGRIPQELYRAGAYHKDKAQAAAPANLVHTDTA